MIRRPSMKRSLLVFRTTSQLGNQFLVHDPFLTRGVLTIVDGKVRKELFGKSLARLELSSFGHSFHLLVMTYLGTTTCGFANEISAATLGKVTLRGYNTIFIKLVFSWTILFGILFRTEFLAIARFFDPSRNVTSVHKHSSRLSSG